MRLTQKLGERGRFAKVSGAARAYGGLSTSFSRLERDIRRRGAFSLYWDSNVLALPTAPFRLTQKLESLKVSINLDVASKKRTLHFEIAL